VSFCSAVISALDFKQHPLIAFVLCYVSAHLALDLLDEQQAEEILISCEENIETLQRS